MSKGQSFEGFTQAQPPDTNAKGNQAKLAAEGLTGAYAAPTKIDGAGQMLKTSEKERGIDKALKHEEVSTFIEPGRSRELGRREERDSAELQRILDKLFDGKLDPPKPTEEEKNRAKDTLHEKVNKEFSKGFQESIKKVEKAIVDGNLKDLTEAFKGMDKSTVEHLVQEVQLHLRDAHSGIKLETRDGKVFVYGQNGNQALEIDPKDGSANIRQFTHGDKDSIIINPNTVLGRDPKNVMEMIGREAVQNINNPQPVRPGDDGAERVWPRERYHPRDPFDPRGTWPDYPRDLPAIPLPILPKDGLKEFPVIPMPRVPRGDSRDFPAIPMPRIPRDEQIDRKRSWPLKEDDYRIFFL